MEDFQLKEHINLMVAPANQEDDATKNLFANPHFEKSESALLPNQDQLLFFESEHPESDIAISEPSLNRDGSYTKEDKFSKSRKATEKDIDILKNIEEIPYRRVVFSKIPDHLKPEYEQGEVLRACSAIMDLLDIRDKYIYYDDFILQHPLDFTIRGNRSSPKTGVLTNENIEYKMVSGVIHFYLGDSEIPCSIVPLEEYYSDLQLLLKNVFDVVTKSFCHTRLKLLQKKFQLHLMCNSDREMFYQKFKKTRDFYNVTKVDNHIHLSGAMNQKHLQKFMKTKLVHFSEETAVNKKGNLQTLKQVFDSLGVTAENLTVDVLDVYADHKTFHRFDRFNLKFNPMGTPLLREIFLKTDNYLNGRYFAEITQELIKGIEKEKYILPEYRISIYGRNPDEWDKLAVWFNSFQLKSKSVKWLIQVPRLFSVYKASNQVNKFQEFIDNVFGPVVEASLYPEKHEQIAKFLEEIVGFDSVDDESKNEKVTTYANYKKVLPKDWTSHENPPYSYYCYYMYANIYSINQLRAARGLNTFAFRPHCGEAGFIDHLASSYLTSHGINHGIELQNSPVLQYLYYLKQIGLSMSPLSNNKLFLKFLNNPFHKFFERGLNVTLSTDAPLMFHLTKEPLIEEYSVVAQALELNTVSLCELARNSVLQSGFSFEKKTKWLGDEFLKGGPNSNDTSKTNLSWIRYAFRYETYIEEMDYIRRHSDHLYV